MHANNVTISCKDCIESTYCTILCSSNHKHTSTSRECGMILSYDLAPTLPLSPSRPATYRKTEKERQLADGRGGRRGAGRSQIQRKRESLVPIQYSPGTPSLVKSMIKTTFKIPLRHNCTAHFVDHVFRWRILAVA
jgi:hypothetical protein